MTKTFKLEGLNLYITNVKTKDEAAITALVCGWGVTSENLLQVERVPKGVPIYGPISKPIYDGDPFAVDPLADCYNRN